MLTRVQCPQISTTPHTVKPPRCELAASYPTSQRLYLRTDSVLPRGWNNVYRRISLGSAPTVVLTALLNPYSESRKYLLGLYASCRSESTFLFRQHMKFSFRLGYYHIMHSATACRCANFTNMLISRWWDCKTIVRKCKRYALLSWRSEKNSISAHLCNGFEESV